MSGAITERELVRLLKSRRDQLPLEHYQAGTPEPGVMLEQRGIYQGWGECIDAIGEIFKQATQESEIDDGREDDENH